MYMYPLRKKVIHVSIMTFHIADCALHIMPTCSRSKAADSQCNRVTGKRSYRKLEYIYVDGPFTFKNQI